jgi:hypothetical protein
MRDHIKILGILNIVMGSLTALIGVIALLAMGTIAGVIAASLRSAAGSDFHDGVMAAPIAATIGMVIAIFFFALGLPAIIGGWGLLHYRPWSRILMIVISVLHLFHIPLGTALGVYGLWVLLNEDSRRLLESGGAYVPTQRPAYGPMGPSV